MLVVSGVLAFSLSGRISLNGIGVSGIAVKAKGFSSVTTDMDGNFIFALVPAGEALQEAFRQESVAYRVANSRSTRSEASTAAKRLHSRIIAVKRSLSKIPSTSALCH